MSFFSFESLKEVDFDYNAKYQRSQEHKKKQSFLNRMLTKEERNKPKVKKYSTEWYVQQFGHALRAWKPKQRKQPTSLREQFLRDVSDLRDAEDLKALKNKYNVEIVGRYVWCEELKVKRHRMPKLWKREFPCTTAHDKKFEKGLSLVKHDGMMCDRAGKAKRYIKAAKHRNERRNVVPKLIAEQLEDYSSKHWLLDPQYDFDIEFEESLFFDSMLEAEMARIACLLLYQTLDQIYLCQCWKCRCARGEEYDEPSEDLDRMNYYEIARLDDLDKMQRIKDDIEIDKLTVFVEHEFKEVHEELKIIQQTRDEIEQFEQSDESFYDWLERTAQEEQETQDQIAQEERKHFNRKNNFRSK